MGPTVNFGTIDRAVVVLYLAATLAVGLSFLRREKTSAGYFLASRTLTLPALVATLVATWYGGILAVGEWTHQYGLSELTVYCFPYYIFALVFALWLAPKIRQAELYTIPDKIDEAYGRPAGLVAALLCYGITNPAAYVLMLGVLLELIFGLHTFTALVVGMALSTVYVYAGGFRSDVRVNIFQFVLMFAGFILMLSVCLVKLGGPGWLIGHLPASHLSLKGGNSTQYLLAWFFIALMTLVDPSFHQRCYAAESPQVARRGILVSILFWMLFDTLTCSCGLYAKAALPDLANPTMAYPMLGQTLLPPLLKGFFFVAMLATVMSTVVSYTFLCGVTFARDLIWRLRGGDEDEGVALWSAVGLLLTSVMAVALAYFMPSVKDIWYDVGTTFVPGLLLPMASAYSPRWRVSRSVAPWAMLLATGTSLTWLVIGRMHLDASGWAQYPLGLEPMYPGLGVSVAIFLLGRARAGGDETNG